MTANKTITLLLLATLAAVAMTVPGNATGADMYTSLENEVQSVRPSVPEYSVQPNLSNVVNLPNFESELSPEQIDMLASNGFVVSPTDCTQMCWVYEQNSYHSPEKIPSFITTDSMLHTYHFFFDYVLREIEANKLLPVLTQLTDSMLRASEADLAAAQDPSVRDAALRNVAYFAVAKNLLDGTPPPDSVADMVSADLQKIENHEGRDTSEVTGFLLDFSQFVPRGHYTRTEELGKYFKTMMWYGLVGFPIPGGDVGLQPTIQALLIASSLRTTYIGDTPAMDLWETIYEPTTFFVGTSDDLAVYDYFDLMDEVYGASPSMGDFADEGKIRDFADRVNNLPGPRIEQFVPITQEQEASGELTAGWRQFRFMGQRFIPDSRIMQELVMDKVPGREFPSGLDVLAALGSDRALENAATFDDSTSLPGYNSQMNKMRGEINDTSLETWQSNLYYGWLWSLESVITPATGGYPAFMRNDAWNDKSLFTALGSWTELRHDTVLYAKQSGAECGDWSEVGPPKGYVEPNIEFWTRMQWLIGNTRDGLAARDLSDEVLSDRFNWLADLVTICRSVAMKELRNEEASEDEYRRLESYGGALEGLMLSCAGGDLLDEADKDMAVVVDVHTNMDTVLQEGTGRAGAIYVIVPIQGDLYLTRGAVYLQYEFTHPASERLTDEQWREMLNNGEQPPFAPWTDSFLVGTEQPLNYQSGGGGC